MEQKWNLLILPVAFAILLGAAFFWKGLYAPGQQLLATILCALAVLVMRSTADLSTTEVWGMLMVFVFAGVSLGSPVVAGQAAHGPVIAAGWLLAMVLGKQLTDPRSMALALGRMWAWTGLLMVFGGLGAMSFLPVHHSGRLASFLGYPIAVGMLGLLGLAGSLPPLKQGQWWASILAFANGVVLVLSGSRGVWAVAALLVGYLVWANPGLLRRVWAPMAVALAVGLWAGPAVAAHDPSPALAAFGFGCLTVILVQRFHYLPITLPTAGLGWLVALAMAPGWGWLLGRATALPLTEGSSVERLTFLRDGLALAKELPLGAGYRAWSALHLQGASYGYYSAEVHSAPLDLILAFGWIGGAGFLLLLGRFLWELRKGRQWSPEELTTLAGLGALGLHALVDWDLSYGVFMIPLWLGFGLIRSGRPTVRLPVAVVTGVAGLCLAAALSLGAGDVMIDLAQQALTEGDAVQAQRHAAMGVALQPWSDTGHATLGRAFSQQGKRDLALASFQQARKYGPLEPWYAELQARELIQVGRWVEAAAAYREMTQLWPWHVPAYEIALEAHLDLIMRATLSGEDGVVNALRASGQQILRDLDQQKAREPARAPRKPMQTDTPVLRQARAFLDATRASQ